MRKKAWFFKNRTALGILGVTLVFGILATGCPTGSEPETTTNITLSGTIGTITVNGAPASGEIWIIARSQNGNWLESTQKSESGAWSIAIPSTDLESTTSISFQVRINISGSWLNHDIPDVTKPYTGQSISGIALGDVTIAAVTLSGTIGTITVNGAPPSGNIWIQAYNQDGGNYLGETSVNSQGGAWSIAISSTNSNLASATSISFQVQINTGGSWLYHDIPDVTKPYTAGQSISGIELGDVTIAAITLSGTIGTVTVNGAPYSGNMWIDAYNQNGSYLGGYNTSYSGNGAWSIVIPSTNTNLASTTSISFKVLITNGYNLRQDISDVTKAYTGQSISGIELGDVTIAAITLSGTIGTITVNGAPASGSIWIQAYNQDGNFLGNSENVDSGGGAWSIAIPSTNTNLASTTSISFQVRINYLSQKTATKTYSGQSISGIELGNVALAAVTLSGTIGSITVNDAPPSGDIWISAYNQDGNRLGETLVNSQGGAWSIVIPSTNLESTTSISFRLGINTDGSYLNHDIPAATKPYTGQSISGIELGNVALAAVTLSGTIGTVTVNGTPYSGNMWINAYNQDGNYLGGHNTSYSGSGAWSIAIPSTNTNLASTTSIKFRLEITDGFHLQPDIPAATKPYTAGQSISGIELGDVAVTTES
ncbi:MAG: hypothetical protein LBK00_02405 [Treponema sp.]|jgi:hypothetical protein|nr:hypothetical protein [Treponema sp.]